MYKHSRRKVAISHFRVYASSRKWLFLPYSGCAPTSAKGTKVRAFKHYKNKMDTVLFQLKRVYSPTLQLRIPKHVRRKAKTEIRRLYYLASWPRLVPHVRTVSTNHSELSHCVKKWTNGVASRGVTPQECGSSTVVSVRFTSAGAVGG